MMMVFYNNDTMQSTNLITCIACTKRARRRNCIFSIFSRRWGWSSTYDDAFGFNNLKYDVETFSAQSINQFRPAEYYAERRLYIYFCVTV